MKTETTSAYAIPNVGCLIGKAYQKLTSQLEAALKAAGLDITASEYLVLRVLYNRDGLQQCEIVDTLGKDKASVCRTVASLSRKGLVDTESISHKCLRVWLSLLGRDLQPAILAVACERHQALISMVREGDMEVFVRVLNQILD